MYKFIVSALLFLGFISNSLAQKVVETPPPFNIKTVAFYQNGQVSDPIIGLRDSFQLEFDDLFGNEADYYYEIQHCDYNWNPSGLSKIDYIQGFDNQRIQNYTNSFNTLQLYSHYRLSFPNKLTQFLISGNYLIKILNEEKEVVFSRKLILFEDIVQVPVQVKRARNISVIKEKQNLEFSILSPNLQFQNPTQNVKVLLVKNGEFKNAISNIKPMYTIGNDLIYKYDSETQFWGGNEFLYFENKDIRSANNYVGRVDSKEIYNAHLYQHDARANKPYTLAPDINGSFLVNNLGAEDFSVESDYAWVFFTLSAPANFTKKDIYVNGKFNNYTLGEENRMEYNAKNGLYEKAIMIKQGFTNYQYQIADKNGVIDQKNAIDGNFYETENSYIVLVYYRESNQRYDRVIGRGAASSLDITN